MYVTVSELKSHVGIYFSERDDSLAILIEAAERNAQNFLGAALSDFTTDSTNSPPDLDADLLPTVKLYVLEQCAMWLKDPGGKHEASPDLLQMLHFERTGLGV
jgi:hypothetical protein